MRIAARTFLRLFEIARVLVRLDHVASFIVNKKQTAVSKKRRATSQQFAAHQSALGEKPRLTGTEGQFTSRETSLNNFLAEMTRILGHAKMPVEVTRKGTWAMQSRRFSGLRVIGILAIIYFLAGKLGLMLASLHASASPTWPPAGMALSALR